MSDVPADAGPAAVRFEDAVARVPFLRALSAKERERLRPYAEIRRVAQGQPIWSLDEGAQEFIFVVDGHVKLTRPCENGREVILDVAGPGELLCAGAVCAFVPYCCTCLTLDKDVIVVALPRRDVLHIVDQNPSVSASFVRETTGREMRLARRIVELVSGQVEQRVSALLLRLADQAGTATNGGPIRIPLKLSRQDLADLCGTTLETAIRTMTKLSREGIVRAAAAGFVISDRPKLERLARGRSER